MTKHLQVYKCDVCGNIVEVVHAAAGTLVCCGKNMTLQEPGTIDASLEKHVPVIEKIDGGVKVKVGSVAHPMEEAHYIEWIEAIANGKACRRFLKPGDAPEAAFNISAAAFTVRAYCNLHGLWQA